MSQTPAEINEIKELEVIAFHSWPAKVIIPLGDWIMRADAGVTRRANSVFPYGDPDLPLKEAIEYVIKFYRSRELIPRFQMTKASEPAGLDNALEKRGFAYEMPTLFQTCRIEDIIKVSAGYKVEMSSEPDDEWFSSYSRISGHSAEVLRVRKGIFERMPVQKSFASVREGGQVIGISIGVIHRGWLGIFGVRTDDDHMRKGVAKSINRALVSWAEEMGAKNAYLQVEADNQSAINLYESLGFRSKFTYWYRQLLE
ncbi:MAG: GNAT family N-acetyltransferase [Candidatus Thorarchaeota archaeon]